jgi:SMI1/KNR4 family protein SUKH-1
MGILNWIRSGNWRSHSVTRPIPPHSEDELNCSSPLLRIQRKLANLRALDPEYRLFGSSIHRYELMPPVPESAVLQFEGKHGIRLPEDYRSFLLQVSEGEAGPYYGLYPFTWICESLETEGIDISLPFIPEPEEEDESEYDGRIRLSHHGCGLESALIVTGAERGKVWDDFGRPVPTGKSFLEWYESWLDEGLKKMLSHWHTACGESSDSD